MLPVQSAGSDCLRNPGQGGLGEQAATGLSAETLPSSAILARSKVLSTPQAFGVDHTATAEGDDDVGGHDEGSV
jgi:hypothetical protein